MNRIVIALLLGLAACGPPAAPAPTCAACRSTNVATVAFDQTCGDCGHVRFEKRNGERGECAACHGTGRDPAKAVGKNVPICPQCRGCGAVYNAHECKRCRGTKVSVSGGACAMCAPAGDLCPHCKGEGLEPLSVQREADPRWPCGVCRGAGISSVAAPAGPAALTYVCYGCDGSGKTTFGPDKRTMDCALCRGTGRSKESPVCPPCSGTGRLKAKGPDGKPRPNAPELKCGGCDGTGRRKP